MVKRIAWYGRNEEFTREVVDARLREKGADLPAGLPTAGWKADKGSKGVVLSSEQFPGSSPVWIWEE